MNFSLTEDTYARFKALGFRDDEVVYLLGVSTNRFQRFKSEMDHVAYEYLLKQHSKTKNTTRYFKRIKSIR